MPMKRLGYRGDFASCEMSNAYEGKVWKRVKDTGEDLKTLPTLDEQAALMTEREEVVAAQPAAAAATAVGIDALLAMNKGDGGKLKGALFLDEVDRA